MRTERPTPKRLREARARGEVARSPELSGVAGFAAAAVTLLTTGAAGAAVLAGFVRDSLAAAPGLPDSAGFAALERGLTVVAVTAGPVLLAALVAATLVGGLQVGLRFTAKPLALQLGRLSPWVGLGRRAREGATDLARVGIFLGALLIVVGWTLAEAAGPLLRLTGAGPAVIAAELLRQATTLAWRGGLVLLAAAAADYGVRWLRLRRDLMMTRAEVRREQRDTEGDPHRKAERARLHVEALRHHRIEQVLTADLVVTGPPHMAVALRYDARRHGAPQVLARGSRLVAERIKQLARKGGVPLVHDAGLTRALWPLRSGDEIPEALYDSVAELWRVIRGARAPGGPDD
ncbi:MAG: EscU/YscU/HrcU family type III secretion system export apparatus switch protein [bacterium]